MPEKILTRSDTGEIAQAIIDVAHKLGFEIYRQGESACDGRVIINFGGDVDWQLKMVVNDE